MGIVFRQSIKTTIITFTGALIGAVTNLVYTFALAKSELGFFTNTIYVSAVMQLFVAMGFGSVIYAFTQRYEKNDERRKMLMTVSFAVTIITSIIFGIIFILLRQHFVGLYKVQDQEILNRYYYYIPLLVGVWAIMSLLELYLVSQVKVAQSVFMREILLRILNLVLAVLLYYKIISFHFFIVSSILVYIIPTVLLYFLSARAGIGFSTRVNAFSKDEYREIFKYAWYHLLFGLSVTLIGFIDTLMLGQLDKTGFESVAPYRIATYIITIIVIPYRAMSSSSFPIINQAFIDNDTAKLKDLFTRSGVNILLVAVAMCSVMICNLDSIIKLLPAGYDAVKPIVMILVIGRLIDMGTGINNELISISKYYKFNFRVSALLILLIIIFNRLLIPDYGIYGAAWGVTAALAIFNILKMIFLYVKMGLHPFNRNSIYILLAGLVVTLIGYYIPSAGNIAADVLIKSVIILFIYGIISIRLKFSEDLNKYFNTIRENKRLF